MSTTARRFERGIRLTWSRFTRALFLGFAMLLIASMPVSATYYARKISGTMQSPGSDVQDTRYLISPDGNFVVFVADREIVGASNVYSVPVAGGQAVRISNEATASVLINQIAITPDSSRVIYKATPASTGVAELFSVPIGGGTVTRISGDMTANGDVYSFVISPNSSYVVYRADQEVDQQYELYRTPVGARSPTRVSPDLDPADAADVDADYDISPDALWIVLRANDEGGTKHRLWGYNTTSGIAHLLNGTLPANGSVASFKTLPDNLGVVYLADANPVTDGVYNLFIAAYTNPAALTQLSNSPGARSINDYECVVVEGQVRAVLYIAEHGPVAGKFELYGVMVAEPMLPWKVNGAICDTWCDVHNFKLTPNSYGVVYRVDDAGTGSANLFAALINGTGRTPLNPTMASGHWVGQYAISPNSARVVYAAQQDGTAYELYSIAITGGEVVKLNRALAAGTDVIFPTITPNGAGVLYMAQEETSASVALFLTPITARQVIRMNAPIQAAGGNVISYVASADNQSLAYLADSLVDSQNELFLVKDVELLYLPMAVK